MHGKFVVSSFRIPPLDLCDERSPLKSCESIISKISNNSKIFFKKFQKYFSKKSKKIQKIFRKRFSKLRKNIIIMSSFPEAIMDSGIDPLAHFAPLAAVPKLCGQDSFNTHYTLQNRVQKKNIGTAIK